MKLRNVAIAALSLLTLFGGGAAVYGTSQVKAAQQQFVYSGYLLDGSETKENGYAKYTFEAGTTYKTGYPDSVIFKDTAGVQVATNRNAFLHYADGSLSALTDGVIVDLNNMSNGMLNNFGINAGTILERRDSSYVVDSISGTLYLDDFLWKINDSQYILVSSTIDITTGNQAPIYYNDYVEMRYYNEGILMLITENGAYRTVASDCVATVNSGIQLDLSARTVTTDEEGTKMSMEQIVLDSNEVIDVLKPIMSAQKSDDLFSERQMNEAIKIALPTFEVIDGEDGEAGEAGEDGEDGEAGKKGLTGADGLTGKTGENGKTGIDGIAGPDGAGGAPGAPGEPGVAGTSGTSGQNGQNGQNGMGGPGGSSGKKGTDGLNGDDAIIEGGLIEENEDVILPQFSLENFDAESHAVSAKLVIVDEGGILTDMVEVELLRAADGKVVGSYEPFEPGAGGAEIAFTELMPDTDYRIRVTATYVVKDENGSDVKYENVFLMKSFTTEAVGISVNLVYATDNSLTFQVTSPDYLTVSSYFLSISNEDGTPVANQSDVQVRDEEITFSGLDSNTAYLVKVKDIQIEGVEGSIPTFGEQKYYTLKKKPTLGQPQVIVNKVDGVFDMRLGSVEDSDLGIAYYRYEVYDCTSGVIATTPVKTYHVSTNRNVVCEVDELTIKRNHRYRVLVVASFNDNEKTVEYSSAYSDDFGMDGTPYPSISFVRAESGNGPDSLAGEIVIKMNGGKLKTDELGSNPIRIVYRSSVGKSYEKKITDINEITTNDSETYKLPFEAINLRADDSYTIEVWGTFSLQEAGEYWRYDTLIGTLIEKTKPTGTVRLSLSKPAQTTNHFISFAVQMDPKTNAGTEEEQGLDARAYETASVLNLEIKDKATDTVIYSHEYRNDYNPSVGDGEEKGGLKQVFGGTEMIFTEDNMPGINTDLLKSNAYIVKVTAVSDYTEYENEVKLETNLEGNSTEWEFDKNEKLPDVNQILSNPITVLEITNSMAAAYDKSIDGLDGNAIVGYELRPNYGKLTGNEDAFIFYAYEEADLAKSEGTIVNESAESFYNTNGTNGSLVFVKEQAVNGVEPTLRVWFDEEDNMGRGQKYVFSFEVKMKDASIFPERAANKAAITGVYGAPYIQPTIKFVHWSTTADGKLVYQYKISAQDANAVEDSLTSTITSNHSVTMTIDGATPGKLKKDGNIGEITYSGVTGSDKIKATLTERKYKSGYSDGIVYHTVIDHCVEEVISAQNAAGKLTFSVKKDDAIGRLEFTVTDLSGNTAVYLNRIVALKVTAKIKDGDSIRDTKEQVMPLRAISGANATGYLYYSELGELGDMELELAAVYDIGEAGFSVLEAGMPVAVQTVKNTAGTSGGKYIIPNASSTGYMAAYGDAAMNSWYTVENKHPLNNGSFATTHMLDENFKYPMSLNATIGGTRLVSLDGQDFVTIKKLDDTVQVPYTGGGKCEITISEMPPTITVNANETSYTIYPTADSAVVKFILNGHQSLLQNGKGTVYIDLFTVDKNNKKTPVRSQSGYQGSWASCEITAATNYEVELTGLEINQRYAVQIWYEKAGVKTYPLDTYQPEISGSLAYFYFTTKDSIAITNTYVTYSADGYTTRKRIKIGLNLNDNVGFDIRYDLVTGTLEEYEDSNGKKLQRILNQRELLTATELQRKGIITLTENRALTGLSYEAVANVLPGTWKVGEEYITLFDRVDLFLLATPVSQQNAETPLGESCIIPLRIPQPTTPYYNVKTIPGAESFTIQIPKVADPGRMIVNDHYMIRIYQGDADVTPESMVETRYNSTQAVTVPVETLKDGTKPQKDVIYRVELYAILDTNNDGTEEEITKDIVGIDTRVMMVQARTLGDEPYSFGELKLVNTTVETLALYLIDSVGLEGMVTTMEYTIVAPNGDCETYSDPFALYDKGNGQKATLDLRYTFDKVGTYTVNFRFLNINGVSIGNDTALTYIKIN